MEAMKARRDIEVTRVKESERRLKEWKFRRNLSEEAIVQSHTAKEVAGRFYYDDFTFRGHVYEVGDCVELVTQKGQKECIGFAQITTISTDADSASAHPRTCKVSKSTPPVLLGIRWFWTAWDSSVKLLGESFPSLPFLVKQYLILLSKKKAGQYSRDLKLSFACECGSRAVDATSVLSKIVVERREIGDPPPPSNYYFSFVQPSSNL